MVQINFLLSTIATIDNCNFFINYEIYISLEKKAAFNIVQMQTY